LRFVESPAAAARSADLVQENTPEKPELKARVLAEIDGAATPYKIILSSTGGIPPSQLQEACAHPERVVVVHPFNPSHLIPLVEVIGGKKTAPEVVQWAIDFARYVGKQPIRLNVEANGHMTNRLQFALVREAVNCLLDGIASAKDIDAAVRYGLGPRWMLMGSLLTLHLAGGPGGMKGILDHAGKAIEEWWTPMGQPHLTPETKARLVAASDEVSEGQGIASWVAWRDQQLVDVIKLQTTSESREPKRSQGE
jgi:carnitine 3-dehydrogenase